MPIERLEIRQLLTWSASLTGTAATFTVGSAIDSIDFSQDGDGNLEHSTLTAPAGQSFADDLDFDSTLAGSQHLVESTTSTVNIDGSAYDFGLVTGSASSIIVPIPFNLETGRNSEAYIDDSAGLGDGTFTASASGLIGSGVDVNFVPTEGPVFGNVELKTGAGNNTVNVQGTNIGQGFVVFGSGSDTIKVGDAGRLSAIYGGLILGSSGPGSSINVDDSADPNSTNGILEDLGTGSYLNSLTQQSIVVNSLEPLTIKSGSGADTQTINFAGAVGTPISGGVTYDGGGDSTLILEGEMTSGPFTNEVEDATGPGAGNISLDGSTINFSGLKPVIDSTPATNFTFNDTGAQNGLISVGAGATVDGQPTTLISSTAPSPQFEQETYANKTNVTINTGAGNDVVAVTGSALLAGSSTTIDGQGGTNTLTYDAGGSSVVIAPTGTPGQATITRVGSGSLLVDDFQRIDIINGQVLGAADAPPTPVFGTNPAVHGTDGVPLTNVDVATFTTTDSAATAASFGATINWGDGTSTAGTIVPDASNATLFHVEGSHTYTSPSPAGGFTIEVSVSQTEAITSPISGITLAQVSTASTTSMATIADAALTAQGTTIALHSGILVPPVHVASFTYGGVAPLTNFSGTINWGDGSSEAFTSSNITAIGTPSPGSTYLVDSSHLYSNFGTYPVTVTITSAGGSSTVASSTAVVTDSPILPVPITAAIPATEGTSLSGLLASFDDVNATQASNFLATIAWGDGHVSQGTVTASTSSGVEYNISGTNTYANAGSYTATISVRDTGIPGGSMATILVPITVAGAAISQSPDGVTNTTAIDNQQFTADVVSFVSANPDATASDFVASIRWGDASSGSYSAGTVIQDADGQFEVSGTHTYTQPAGTNDPDKITVTVKELASGITANIIGQAIVDDAPVTASGATVTGVAGASLSGLVASFDYGGGPMDPSYFGGTINWGDGTTSQLTASEIVYVTPTYPPPTTALGTPVNDVATYQIDASHTYSNSGTFPISVEIKTINGSTAVASSTAVVSSVPAAPVAPAPLNLSGTLNPASDSGVSDTDAITNDPRPNFYGSAAPGTHISLYAIPVGTTIAVPIGQAVANGVGAWSITSITMADGRYNIEAIGIDPTGVTSALDVILPNALQGPLVVDTVAPRVESVQYKPLSGRVIVTFQDDSSGLDEAQVIDGANYTFTRVAALPGQANLKNGPGLPLPSSYLVTSLSTSPQVDPSAPQVVVVTINKGQPIRGGYYRLTIKSGGIEDVAGNALDGEFYGDFPSGNNLSGGNFVANLNSVHNTVEPPLPVTSSASPLNPPGTRPTATTIPTVHAHLVTKTTVKSETTLNHESKPKVILGKAKPKAKKK